MLRHLEDKIALITGAGSGIGRASALAFAREGAKVVVADVDVKGGEETVRFIKEAGGESIFIQTDVAKAAEVEAMVNEVVKTYGRLDCAHNNAGIPSPQQTTTELSEEDWDLCININLKGVWLCMKYEIPQMLRQGKGAIVNTSSTAGLVGFERRPVYAASKHGVLGLTKVAALEYAPAGIRVNAICPGITETPLMERLIAMRPEFAQEMAALHPIGRMATPEEMAEAVIWLCSDAASYVTGHPLVIDGGRVAK